ncbi:MAG: phosphotransferase, partial [Nitrospiraceae bacterium]|nr:phosphotransferase [Nitrospiraceae bacterium]
VLETMSLNGETVYRSPGADCGRIEAQGYLVLEQGSKVREGAILRNCIVMPGAKISGRERKKHENSIIGPDYCLELPEAMMRTGTSPTGRSKKPGSAIGPGAGAQPLFPSANSAYLIGLGGSDRRYFRIRGGRVRESNRRVSGSNGSIVLMECLPGDQDFERHIEYTRFFAEMGVPVPGILAVDGKGKQALFEDLGDISLYAWLKLPRQAAEIAEVYKKIMGILSILHTRALGQLDKCPLLAGRPFDYDHLRWETGYFLEQFVTGFMGILPPRGLDEEFHLLASLVDSFSPKAVVHRDFQSQNIMMEADWAGQPVADQSAPGAAGPNTIAIFPRPRIIDYQGARIGPPAYDLASILWDPYSRLDRDLRDEALHYYIGLMEGDQSHGDQPPDPSTHARFSVNEFKKTILPCRLQRHMQALGAYAFLSRAKGKRYFLKHIPEGLRLLKEDIAECSRQKNFGIEIDLPVLSRLVNGLDFKG